MVGVGEAKMDLEVRDVVRLFSQTVSAPMVSRSVPKRFSFV